MSTSERGGDVPTSTYRLQVHAGFDLDAAADTVSYLRALGAGWAYLSPILQSAHGSAHGYDVVDPTRVDDARGGPAGLAHFSAAAREAGLGIVVDIVPNHQGVAAPDQNPWWWDVLANGEASCYAASFDIDWRYGGGRVRMPVLGGELDDVVAAGEITVAPPEEGAPLGTARYFDLVLPLAAGTEPARATSDATVVHEVLAQQHWQAVFWRREAEALNYRRFFTVTGLAGVRVEDPAVFDASHVEVARWLREGLIDGLRIDHPDGLADPGGYFDRLATTATPGETGDPAPGEPHRPYTVVEKILEPGEELPAWWATDGTTGYDALAEIDRVLTDPAGEQPLTALDTVLRGSVADWSAMIADTKRYVADTAQAAEVGRLVRVALDAAGDQFENERVLRDALAELLAAFEVYRAYLPAGQDQVAAAAARAAARRPDIAAPIAAVARLVAEPATELSRRFMQTTGPVMAKGVEDRAFYRYTRLTSLTEVGGDPSQFALSVPELHAAFARRHSSWPHALVTLTTHDTKRSEDARARIAVLAELPARWTDLLARLRAHASTGDGPLDNLLWQAVVAAWPASPERLHAYAEKAAREAASGTSWEAPDAAFEQRVHALVDAAGGAARPEIEAFVAEIIEAGWTNSLSAKLLQLAGPGVPDVYQGTELWDHSLVDPDNRRPVDFAARRALLARIDDGWLPPIDADGAAKLLLVSRVLRLRRDQPELFWRYAALAVVGGASDHAIAFDRGEAIAIATRMPVGLAARGGWGDAAVMLPTGEWTDVLTGRTVSASATGAPLAELLSDYPVALLVPYRREVGA